MAKQQSFSDKLKKKKAAELGYNVKVIKGFNSDSGTVKFVEKFVLVKDLNDLSNVDISK